MMIWYLKIYKDRQQETIDRIGEIRKTDRRAPEDRERKEGDSMMIGIDQ